MAVAYTQQDKYEEALVQHQKSLDIRIRLAGWFEWFEWFKPSGRGLL
jgi:hypothetical protein